MTITKTTLAAGHYRYMTPIGNFALVGGSDGWTISQYTHENGTIEYGTYPTQREAEAELAALFN